jgi:hypothetical protein
MFGHRDGNWQLFIGGHLVRLCRHHYPGRRIHRAIRDRTTQVTITATSAFDSTKSGSTTITVTAPSPILFIQVSCSPNPIGTGEQTQCTAAVIGVNSDFQSVTWSATQAGYPYPLTNLPCNCISPTGVVTGPQVLGAGFVNVQATSVLDPTKVGNYTVYVHSPGTITSVTPSCTKSTLSPGQDTACTAVVTGSGGYSSAVEWRGSPESVSPSGLYVPQRAYNNGNTYVETITALSVQDQTVSGTFAVNVTPSTTTANNVVPVVVDGGPNAATSPYINGAFTSVTVCVPGTSNCQTIDHILVDTGSVGLRLLAAGPAGGELTLPLPAYISQSDGTNLVECAPFVSGYLWGPVVTADVLTLPDGTGEQASNIEMQVVGQPGQPAVPSTCISSGVGIGTLPVLGAKGILGCRRLRPMVLRLFQSSLHLLHVQRLRLRHHQRVFPGLESRLCFCFGLSGNRAPIAYARHQRPTTGFTYFRD